MRRLWRASKLFGVPIFDDKLKDLNEWDLIFMDYLRYFDDPKTLEEYNNSFTDNDFDEYLSQVESGEGDDLSQYDDVDRNTVNFKDVDINDESQWEEVLEDE